jgi:TPP-dependent indolepyruvate ferredoxin oxidoreductase alpha subunit
VAQVIAHAVDDAGATVVTNVPGFGGTQVLQEYLMIIRSVHPISLHEEVAYSIAHGASLLGKRSATLVKAHGFAKATNAVLDSLSSGTTAGFVVMIFDDKSGKHSDSIFDVVAFLRGLRIPHRVLQARHAYLDVLDAFRRSEELRLPVVLVVDADDLDETAEYSPVRRRLPSPSYEKDVYQHVVTPHLAQYQHRVLQSKLSGRNWRLIRRPTLPRIPDDLPEAYQHTARSYTSLFEVFRKLRRRIVTGDTGISMLFAFPPYDCIDVGTYMGGSIPLAIGAYLAGYHDAWALTGDFAFVAAGHLGLVEATNRGIPLKVLVFSDGKATATGGQPVQDRVLNCVLRGYESYLRIISNPQDKTEVEAILTEATQAHEMRIVLADYRER